MLTDHRRRTSPLDNALSQATQVCTTANGTTAQVAAPGVGKKVLALHLSLVDTSAGAHTCVLKSGTTEKGQLVLPASGGQVYDGGPVECAANEALNTTDTTTATGTLTYAILPA